jgi:hypothetical protein
MTAAETRRKRAAIRAPHAHTKRQIMESAVMTERTKGD